MHHKRFSFQDEYRQFLLSYGVEYDEAYVLIKAFALSGRHYISSCEPRVSLRLPWAMCSIGPSARPC